MPHLLFSVMFTICQRLGRFCEIVLKRTAVNLAFHAGMIFSQYSAADVFAVDG